VISVRGASALIILTALGLTMGSTAAEPSSITRARGFHIAAASGLCQIDSSRYLSYHPRASAVTVPRRSDELRCLRTVRKHPASCPRPAGACMIADGVRRPLSWRSSPVVSSRLMQPARNCTTVQVYELQGTGLWQTPASRPGSVVITDENCSWEAVSCHGRPPVPQ
jgi:hypothetical protein